MKRVILLLVVLFWTMSNALHAQTPAKPTIYQPTVVVYPKGKEKKEVPYSFKHKLKTKVTADVVDPQAAYNKFMKDKNPYLDITCYLGQYDTKYKYTLDGSGTWETLPNGDRLWRLKLTTQSELITGIGVHSSKMNIPQGGKLFFYSDDKKYVVGPVTEPNGKGTKQLLVNSIPGKTIWIEYYEPKAQKNKSTFDIDALMYRFVAFPYGITHKIKEQVPFVNPFREEEERATIEEQKTAKQWEIRGGSTGAMTIDILAKGQWTNLPNGDRICRMGFESRIAYGLTFSVFLEIPKGGYVSFYSTDGQYVSSIHHEASNTNTSRLDMYTMPGDKYIVEYYEPKQHKGTGKLKLKRLETDLTIWAANSNARAAQPNEVACSPNVVCDCDDLSYNPDTFSDAFCDTDLWTKVDTLKKATVRLRMFFPCIDPNGPNCRQSEVDTTIMIYDPNTKYYCSGALINNSSGQPYLLSAHHCIKEADLFAPYVNFSSVGDTIHFLFDFLFETATCDTFLSPFTTQTNVITTGATVVTGNKVGDFMLLKLHEFPVSSLQPYYAGWDAATQAMPQQGLSISHPRGYDKRYAIQDDNISLMPTAQNDSVKPFIGIIPNQLAEQLKDISKSNDGELFALTFDRGATTPGSSGSPYFNPEGRIIGDLAGGYVACEVQSNTTKPNGNNDYVEKYGRMWYYYDKYHTIPNSHGGPLINVSTDGVIDSLERTKTLKYWLQDTENLDGAAIMDGLSATNCEIYMRDNDWDTPNNEPNNTSFIDNAWYDIWASPDIWNCTINQNTLVTDDNFADLLSSTNQEPDFSDSIGTVLNNFLQFRVHNGGNCTSAPASLHLYWTMGSTGEMWPNDWINHRDSLCLVGQEMTIFDNGDPYPFFIPSIPAGETRGSFLQWSPPNFTDPETDLVKYPYILPAGCPNLDMDVQNEDKFEICFLARLQSLDNPIFGIETSNTTQNVLNSNNIVTHNTFLADPTIVGMAQGGSGGGIIQTGHPSIIFIANNNNSIKNLDITLDKISDGSIEALDGLVQIDLIPGDELWQKWQSTGFKGQGIQIIADKLIRVTNMETAKLLDIPFDPKEFEPLKIKITILSYSGKKTPVNAVPPDTYRFKISHRSSNPNIEISKPSACLFELKNIQQYAQTPMPAGIELKCYPNPFKDQINIEFLLPTDAPVSLFLYDMQGKLVHTVLDNTTLTAGLNTYTFNSNDLPKGMYICRLLANNQAMAKKIVKW